MPERAPIESELFRSKEEELQEQPPVFKFIRKEKVIDPETNKEREVEKEYVSVVGVELEVNQEGEGSQFTEKDFEDFAFDEKSLELLKLMATSIKLNQPFLIEGPTDIGKSKAFEYLAYETNNYLLYQSFSGQTDVTELIGKYVPAVEDVRIRFEQILQNRKNLKPETLEILSKLDVDPEKFTLSIDEARQIAESEKITSPQELEKLQWTWSDGTVPRAMKFDKGRGAWLYFDELGAAEPQVLVKINRIFGSDFARIGITENAQNPEIEAVYPEWHSQAGEINRFKIGATTNPPSYAGREPFEKDFLRRWNYQRSDKLTNETFLKRLDFVGHGEEPEIPELKYRTFAESPINLREAKEVDHLLNMAIVEFRGQAQTKLETWGWGRGEQEFRFDEISDALRCQQYLREMQGSDLLETFKDAVRFYYMGKIEAAMKYYFKVDEEEKTKTAKEIGTDKFTVKDYENKQSQRVKELETLLDEILTGVTGPKIEGKNIQEKLKEEIEKLDPEVKRRALVKKSEEIKKKFSKFAKKDIGWTEVKELFEQRNVFASEAEKLQKQGQTAEKPDKGAVDLDSAIVNLEKALKLENEIKEKLKQRRELEKTIKDKLKRLETV